MRIGLPSVGICPDMTGFLNRSGLVICPDFSTYAIQFVDIILWNENVLLTQNFECLVKYHSINYFYLSHLCCRVREKFSIILYLLLKRPDYLANVRLFDRTIQISE